MIRMPRRKEVRWFTRGEFSKTAISHEGDNSTGDNTLQYVGSHYHMQIIIKFIVNYEVQNYLR